MLTLLLFSISTSNAATCGPAGAPLTWAQMASVRDLTDKVAPPDLGDIEPLLGTCDERTRDRQTVIDQMRSKFSDINAALGRRAGDGDLVKGALPDVRKEDHSPTTMEDFLAVDMVARTLYSEVGTQPKCGIQYVAALGRLIMNRADAAAESEGKRNMWARAGTNDIGNPLVDVVLSPKQFQVWNPNSSANRSAMCPATAIRQKYAIRDAHGRQVSSGPESFNEWVDCVSVASYMVFRQKQFREITSGMTAVNYTSGEIEGKSRPSEGYHAINVKMHGKTVPNNPNCMQFWDDPQKKKKTTPTVAQLFDHES